MCDALRELMKDEILQAERRVSLRSIESLMSTLSLNADQAMDVLKIPSDEREMYRAMLKRS